MPSLFRTIVSLPTSYGLSTLLWKWNFILSLRNLQGFYRNIAVFTLQVFPFATLEKIQTKMVFGAKLQNNEQSSLTLFWWCLSTKALLGSIQPAWAPQRSTHYFAHWGGSVNVGWSLPLTTWVTEAGGCLSWCLSVCLKVLLPGAGWLNVWTTVNRWIALLFWSSLKLFILLPSFWAFGKRIVWNRITWELVTGCVFMVVLSLSLPCTLQALASSRLGGVNVPYRSD